MTPPHAPDFVPISPNPFIVGNPVRGRTMFFGRESEFELVRKRFQGQERGSLLIFCGERRSGKTSILFQIMDGRLGQEFIPVLIDMQSMAVDDEASFLGKLAGEIRTAAPDPSAIHPLTLGPGVNEAAEFHRFVGEVLRALPDRKLVLLFDEYELFENKIDAGVLSPDVLHVLASLMEQSAVFLIFTGSQHLESRRRDFWAILGRSLYRTVSYLERNDALNLIQKPVEGLVNYQGDTIANIYRLTSGQPFYTQAVCQNLVDRLNDSRTNDATEVRLAEVTQDLIENPLPQMIFLWDGLEPDEKLVLALLAEALATPAEFATAQQVEQLMKKRRYPLDLTTARINTVTEKLFQQEMLLKDEGVGESVGYAFRMDLWRLWVRRMHSPWQVVREVGIKVRKPLLPPGVAWGGGLLLTAAVVAAGVIARREAVTPREVRAPDAWVALDVTPPEAAIFLEGRRVSTGSFHDRIPAGLTQELRMSARGYADSSRPLKLAPADTQRIAIRLRALLGDLRVETDPPGAEIRVDDVSHGAAPVLVRSLAVASQHRVEARVAGRPPAQMMQQVVAGQVTLLRLPVPVATGELAVGTEPPGAQILLAGRVVGTTPGRAAVSGTGPVALGLRLTGYQDFDTTVLVVPGTTTIHRVLIREPPGTLIIQGDLPAQMFVDQVSVAENLQNSRPQSLPPGLHQIRVVLLSGAAVDTSVTIGSRERVVFDYSNRTVKRVRP